MYDSALSHPPQELAGAPTIAQQAAKAKPLTLRTGDASVEMQNALAHSFRRDHAAIRAMLQEGFKAIVYAPRMISGWRDGEVRTVRAEDDDVSFKWSWKNFDAGS